MTRVPWWGCCSREHNFYEFRVGVRGAGENSTKRDDDKWGWIKLFCVFSLLAVNVPIEVCACLYIFSKMKGRVRKEEVKFAGERVEVETQVHRRQWEVIHGSKALKEILDPS
jgi:hypothetical protein